MEAEQKKTRGTKRKDAISASEDPMDCVVGLKRGRRSIKECLEA